MALVKGWIGDAADDIKRRGSLELEVVQSIIQKHYRLKLLRGPLGDGENAMMPVPLCEQCIHWDRKRTGESRDGTVLAVCMILDITTQQRFGCTVFQSQTPPK
jgi:hypothetical protein